jgi:type II secretory ATPase GspE/PulE/Tfp pilus assembly ATPase PilB-like protein
MFSSLGAVSAPAGSALLVEQRATALVPRAVAFRFDVLALRVEDGKLHVALSVVDDDEAIKALRLATRMPIVPVGAPRDLIRDRLIDVYGAPDRVDAAAAPAVRLVDALFARAVALHASDIHIEPTPEGGRVRFRIDGIVRPAERIGADVYDAVVTRVKVVGGIDIADRRRPHDGRYTFTAHDRPIDARIASIPTIDGEKLAIRLLDLHTKVRRLPDLGMEPALLAAFRRVASAPHGLVVVTGPTGSGKTTTLYAAVHELDADALNICSVEDPIEMRMPGIAQVQINAKAGLTFPTALRAFVRQDPNVIMIGEMRDEETVAVGISAALTGQLVMTTLHSNDAPRTLDRLLELGAERYAVASAVSAILGQRLVRRLCECKRRTAVPDSYRMRFPSAPVTWCIPDGCDLCSGTGYVGRIGIFELLVIDRALSEAIVAGEASSRIAVLAAESGYRPMIADGLRRVASGDTSFAEVERVASWR